MAASTVIAVPVMIFFLLVQRKMRFGLTGGRPRTLEEVGRAFNVTRERIRQIENHTLKKLESLPEAQRLRDAG